MWRLQLQHSPVVASITAESLFHSFWDMSQLGRRLSSPCRTDLSVPEDRPAAPSCLSAFLRVVRRRTECLTTPRLKASPAGARCGPSWPGAGRRRRRRQPRLGRRASGWAGPPAVCAAAAPGASAAGPPWRSRWWSSGSVAETCCCRRTGKMAESRKSWWKTRWLRTCPSALSPVPDANPQVTEEAGPAVAAVSFAEPLVPPELLQLAQAVGEQQVRQLLVPEAGHALRLLLQLRGAAHPAGGGYVRGLLGWSRRGLLWWARSAPAGAQKAKKKRKQKQRVWFNTSTIRPFQFTPQAEESLKPLSSVCFVS